MGPCNLHVITSDTHNFDYSKDDSPLIRQPSEHANLIHVAQKKELKDGGHGSGKKNRRGIVGAQRFRALRQMRQELIQQKLYKKPRAEEDSTLAADKTDAPKLA